VDVDIDPEDGDGDDVEGAVFSWERSDVDEQGVPFGGIVVGGVVSGHNFQL